MQASGSFKYYSKIIKTRGKEIKDPFLNIYGKHGDMIPLYNHHYAP